MTAALADLPGLLGPLETSVRAAFAAMSWAEDEVEQATRRHPDSADVLYHAFGLIMQRDGMNEEFVYRSHARELLERVVAGEDTRPGTAAEVVLVCAATSALAPFHTTAVGLYMRMWMTAFPDHPVHKDQAADQIHYEALRDSQIDDLEAMVRRRVGDPNRHLRGVTCEGRHFDEPAVCRLSRSHGFFDQGGRWIPQGQAPVAATELSTVAKQLVLDLSAVA